MSAYTVRNLKDVEDAAVKFGLSPAMESRFARRDLGFEQIGLSYQRLAPDARQPFSHRHHEQEEVYVVTDGSGRAKLGDDVVELRRWDAVRVAPGTVRTFAAGPDGLEMLAFGGGSGGMQDAEQLPDAWEDRD